MLRRTAVPLLLAVLLAAVGCQATPQPIQPSIQAQVVAFSSISCAPCQRDKATVKAIEAAGVQVTIIDVDREPQTATNYGVKSVPTYFVYHGDGQVTRTSDIRTVLRILRFLNAIR